MKWKKINFSNIRLVVYDFDGVMTNNKVIVCEDGRESVEVNRSDGLAISVIKKKSVEQLILSTEKNNVVVLRAKKLGIPILNGIDDKKSALLNYCSKRNITLDQVVYIGNDINDLNVMKAIGFPICPIDASKEVKKIVKLVLKVKGGDGVIREFLNYLE